MAHELHDLSNPPKPLVLTQRLSNTALTYHELQVEAHAPPLLHAPDAAHTPPLPSAAAPPLPPDDAHTPPLLHAPDAAHAPHHQCSYAARINCSQHSREPPQTALSRPSRYCALCVRLDE